MKFRPARLSLLAGLLLGSLATARGWAFAHVKMLEPTPRDNRDDHKNDAAPCIARTATQAVGKLTAGATVTVKFGETVSHPGCFLVDFAESDTAAWQMLGTIPHSNVGNPSDAKPRMYSKDVKLPDKPCTKCILRVRQIMLNAEPPTCPPATVPAGDTYYSCANVELAAGGAVDAGAPGGDASTGGSGGTGGSASSGTGGSASGGSTGSGGSANASGGAGGSGGGGAGGSFGAGGASSAGGSGSTGGATGSGGGSGGSSTGGTSGSTSSDSGGTAAGCAVGGSAPSGAALSLLGLLALLIRRRR
jgi:MYXO-CTERM domain-containing protein